MSANALRPSARSRQIAKATAILLSSGVLSLPCYAETDAHDIIPCQDHIGSKKCELDTWSLHFEPNAKGKIDAQLVFHDGTVQILCEADKPNILVRVIASSAGKSVEGIALQAANVSKKIASHPMQWNGENLRTFLIPKNAQALSLANMSIVLLDKNDLGLARFGASDGPETGYKRINGFMQVCLKR